MMTGQEPVYQFNGFQLETAKRSLLDPRGHQVKLLPMAFDTLVFLIENRDRVVSKDDLFSAIWPDTIVEENNLTQNISSLRRAFAEKPHDNRFISTVSGRGYRFVAPVDVVEAITAESTSDIGSSTADRPAALRVGKPWILAAVGVFVLAVAAAGYWYFSWNVHKHCLTRRAALSTDRRGEP
jgi:DNA-binding winged helix-turn-helix (wHTH) protein